MNSIIRGTIENHMKDLLNSDRSTLRSSIEFVLDQCRAKLNNQDQTELDRLFWLNLAELSFELSHISLASLIVDKFGLSQLSDILESSNDDCNNNCRQVTLSYLESYLKPSNQLKKTNQLGDFAQEDSEETVKLSLNLDQWTNAFKFLEERNPNDQFRNNVHRRLLHFERAVDLETDENFQEAMIHYKNSSTQEEHVPRLILKQYVDVAYVELMSYCENNVEMRRFWLRYLKNCDKGDHLDRVCETSNDNLSTVLNNIQRKTSNRSDEDLKKAIDLEIYQFISNANLNKWFDTRQLRLVVNYGSCLSTTSRRILAELAVHYKRINSLQVACGLLLCLGLTNLLNREASSFLADLDRLTLSRHIDATSSQLARCLREHTFRKQLAHTQSGRGNAPLNGNQVVFSACLKLGLIDETLRLIVKSQDIDTDEIADFLATRERGDLNGVDPIVRRSTLFNLKELMQSNPIQSTNVITTVILCIIIFIHKLNKRTKISQSFARLGVLEIMFKYLADFCQSLNFNASDRMIQSTKNLISAVKDNLDAFSDNDIIRESFRTVVDEVASRCMIGANYKNAAMLYSQIEDNISAVKSLMRTGDVDVVINFSLLVHDMTVNRITVNFLKHLRVEKEIIDDFVERCKT